MYDELFNLIKGMKPGIELVADEDADKTAVSERIKTDTGEVELEFQQIDPPRISPYSENFEIRVRAKLDDSAHITDVKPEIYDFKDEVHPNSTAMVNQDYPTAQLKWTDEMSDEEVETLLNQL